MTEKITSLRINSELWKKVKLLAVERGVTLKSLIEELLSSEVEAEGILREKFKVSEKLFKALEENRKRGQIPFIISSRKSAVELVREGRGE